MATQITATNPNAMREQIKKQLDALQRKKRRRRKIFVLLLAAVIVWLVMTYVVVLVFVSGNSRYPTLSDGDLALILRLYKTPQAGDIVFFRPGEGEAPVFKRVIATGGQTVDINFRRGTVLVDGEQLDEPYISTGTKQKYDVEFPLEVPPGQMFVLGDNREISLDSRHSSVGMPDDSALMGKVIFLFRMGVK